MVQNNLKQLKKNRNLFAAGTGTMVALCIACLVTISCTEVKKSGWDFGNIVGTAGCAALAACAIYMCVSILKDMSKDVRNKQSQNQKQK